MQAPESALTRFLAKVSPEPNSGCWLWTGAAGDDEYGRVRYEGRVLRAHQAAYLLFRGPIRDLMVCHKCDTPACVNPDHLFLGTGSDNQQDSVRKGRHATAKYFGSQRGERNGNAKLTAEDVQEIRVRRRKGECQKKIAEDFGVTRANISRICRNESWRGIEK